MLAQHGIRNEINKLVRYYFDAKEDYRLAAKRSKDDPTRCDELGKLCEQREFFHSELQEIETQMDVEQSDNGHVGADFKRDWERLRGSIGGNGLEAALKLAHASDSHAIQQAEHLLEIGLPEPLQSTIRRQLGELRHAVGRLESGFAPQANAT